MIVFLNEKKLQFCYKWSAFRIWRINVNLYVCGHLLVDVRSPVAKKKVTLLWNSLVSLKSNNYYNILCQTIRRLSLSRFFLWWIINCCFDCSNLSLLNKAHFFLITSAFFQRSSDAHNVQIVMNQRQRQRVVLAASKVRE